jgi:Cyclic nucleotide-binding domain/Mycothiol maleylpyruvate isomerase N-terminal domain
MNRKTVSVMAVDHFCDEFVAQTRQLASFLEGRGERADSRVALPCCPGWNVGQLLRHLGGLQRWAEEVVRNGTTGFTARANAISGWLRPARGRVWFGTVRWGAAVASISWIPSDVAGGIVALGASLHVSHYDRPPPDEIDHADTGRLEALRDADAFRFANRLAGWIDVIDGRIVDYGSSGGGLIGSTTVSLGVGDVTVAAVAMRDLTPEPEVGDGWVRFRRTAGGHTGFPLPRAVRRTPYFKWQAPLAWTTLELTLHSDGRSEGNVVGASPFPRHWVYGTDGRLVAKTALIDYTEWSKEAFGAGTPWGGADSPVVVSAVETELERVLSTRLMRGGAKPRIEQIDGGQVLVRQGDPAEDLFLVLDGVVRVDVDGEPIAELGPGSVLGERAVLEGGRRTATVVAVTACKVAVAHGDALDVDAMRQLAAGHHREDDPR